MSQFKNREVVFLDKEWEIHTTYFRWTDFYSILPYMEKFKESMVDIVAINNPDFERVSKPDSSEDLDD